MFNAPRLIDVALTQLVSQSGDFAEWHEQTDPHAKLVEGSVVGFYEGKVGLGTQGVSTFVHTPCR